MISVLSVHMMRSGQLLVCLVCLMSVTLCSSDIWLPQISWLWLWLCFSGIIFLTSTSFGLNLFVFVFDFDWAKGTQTTLCSEKNTPSRFLLYLCGKCLDFHKIFRECSGGNYYSTSAKVRYSFLLMTSCWSHIFMYLNYGFYLWRQTLINVCESARVMELQVCEDISGQWTEN